MRNRSKLHICLFQFRHSSISWVFMLEHFGRFRAFGRFLIRPHCLATGWHWLETSESNFNFFSFFSFSNEIKIVVRIWLQMLWNRTKLLSAVAKSDTRCAATSEACLITLWYSFCPSTYWWILATRLRARTGLSRRRERYRPRSLHSFWPLVICRL